MLVAGMLPICGCIAAAVTAGVVGAGAAGYAYYQGAVQRDFPADMDHVWAAATQAVSDLGLPIGTAVRDNNTATIECVTGDGAKVEIAMEPRATRVPADGQWTHVSVRIALFGDGNVSERVLNQIEARLPPQPTPAVVPVPQPPPPPRDQTGPPPLAQR